MARPIWKGFISFGLVNIPIVLFSAEKRQDIHFHLLDKKTKSRVGYEYISKETGKRIPRDQIIKAYEVDDNEYVEIDDTIIKKIAGENTKTIAIESFAKQEEISIHDFNVPYFLVPDKKGIKGYIILRDTLLKTKKIGIAKVIIHGHEKLAAITPYEDMLVLSVMRFHSAIRTPAELDIPHDLKSYKAPAREMKVAEKLVASMTSKWNPKAYKDEYQIALRKWIEEKHKTNKPKTKMAQRATLKTSGNIINYFDLLKKSMGKTKSSKNKKAAK